MRARVGLLGATTRCAERELAHPDPVLDAVGITVLAGAIAKAMGLAKRCRPWVSSGMPEVQVTDGRPRSLAPVRLPDAAPLDAGRLSDVDQRGRSERYRRLARGLFGPLYRHWFRAEWEGLEHIPRTGAALLVANDAGAIPADAPVIVHGVEEQLGRPLYLLGEYVFWAMPVVSTLFSNLGGVAAHPDNAHRLLAEDRE